MILFVFIYCCRYVYPKVLASVHTQIERYVAVRPDYPALVTQAWRFLLAKDQDSKFRGNWTHTATNTSSRWNLPALASVLCKGKTLRQCMQYEYEYRLVAAAEEVTSASFLCLVREMCLVTHLPGAEITTTIIVYPLNKCWVSHEMVSSDSKKSVD